MRDEPYNNRSQYRKRKHPKYNKKTPVFAALDLGTNNCRLLVATPTKNGFRVIDAFSRIVRLGEGISHSGQLSDEAIERAIDALTICANKIKKRQVTMMRSVATEACRLADNCGDFVDQVHKKTGIALDVISSQEEARLAVMGCQSLFDADYDRAIVFDIGGGSTEIIWIDTTDRLNPEILDWISMPFGVVRLADQYDFRSITKDDYEEIVGNVLDHLAEFDQGNDIVRYIDDGRVQLLGSSGTVTTLASLGLGLDSYDRTVVDGATLNLQKIKKLTNDTAFMSFKERAALSCVGEERADLLVPGCAIFESLLRAWPTENIDVADRGIREGVLRGLLNRAGYLAIRQGDKGISS